MIINGLYYSRREKRVDKIQSCKKYINIAERAKGIGSKPLYHIWRRHPEVKLGMLQGIDRMQIRSRQQTENTVAEDNPMPHFPLLQYHIHTPADTFPHTGEGMKNLFYGQENRVRSGRRSLSHRRFGCLHVQESQSEAARLTILQAKIDYLARQG